MKNLNLISQIQNGGDPTKIASQIEAVLYARVGVILEQVRLQEAASILDEDTGHRLGQLMKKYGYNKASESKDHSVKSGKEIGKTVCYEHPDGPSLKLHSAWDNWTHYNDSKPTKQGSGVDELKSHLSNFHKIAEEVLNEADPTPRVWNNEKGAPIIPSQAEWSQHYQNLALSHVKAQYDAARARWADAVDAANAPGASKHAQAERLNLQRNISAGSQALRKKNSAASKFERVRNKKVKKNQAALHKTVHGVVSGLLGGSGFAHHLSQGITNAIGGKGGVSTPKS